MLGEAIVAHRRKRIESDREATWKQMDPKELRALAKEQGRTDVELIQALAYVEQKYELYNRKGGFRGDSPEVAKVRESDYFVDDLSFKAIFDVGSSSPEMSKAQQTVFASLQALYANSERPLWELGVSDEEIAYPPEMAEALAQVAEGEVPRNLRRFAREAVDSKGHTANSLTADNMGAMLLGPLAVLGLASDTRTVPPSEETKNAAENLHAALQKLD